ncbi:DNA polymerase III, epsilon subunit [Methylocella silvestris BL2]|uniref:DNA polymerase III subunit epsilon n=1 Tax=Methylocella silvestris (strain DSM 15510 / CIP 108128 / LMG 27833 / NCIMB 13906 / BL2) TaxID=395965 RepID=B8EM74_METSB|nr:DNA polymerase III subunit epsilon [Methylocella silvestris]ACK51463.1 DNA polymerase III, epsilon subunit [Methylocella silvestris BL2]
MREIVLDTETTGLDPKQGHRIVEIGAVELLNSIPTGQSFHVYIHPERDMPDEAFRVHGISLEFLTGKPLFAEIVPALIDFLGEAKIIAHNAEFDFRFLNAEFLRAEAEPLAWERVVDTLALARRRFPGASNSLDALCARFGVDTSRRVKHGALLDAEILAEVYAELCGGRQAALVFGGGLGSDAATEAALMRERPEPLAPQLSPQEVAAHAAFVATLGEKAIWQAYLSPPAAAAE